MKDLLGIDPNNPVHHRALQAILHMRHNKDYQDIVAFLQDGLDKLRKNGDIETGDLLKWNQGWRQCLQFVINLPEMAETMVRKKKEQQDAKTAMTQFPTYQYNHSYANTLNPTPKDNS